METCTGPGPFSLQNIRAILQKGHIKCAQVSPTFYEDMGKDSDADVNDALISTYAFDTPWDVWEMHPEGDEMVFLLHGDTDFVLWSEEGEHVIRVNQPGDYVVVPKGA